MVKGGFRVSRWHGPSSVTGSEGWRLLWYYKSRRDAIIETKRVPGTGVRTFYYHISTLSKLTAGLSCVDLLSTCTQKNKYSTVKWYRYWRFFRFCCDFLFIREFSFSNKWHKEYWTRHPRAGYDVILDSIYILVCFLRLSFPHSSIAISQQFSLDWLITIQLWLWFADLQVRNSMLDSKIDQSRTTQLQLRSVLLSFMASYGEKGMWLQLTWAVVPSTF